MRIHTILMGGPFGGEMLSLSNPGGPAPQLRLASQESWNKEGDTVLVQVYYLGEYNPMESQGLHSTHQTAAYFYGSELESRRALVTKVLTERKHNERRA